MSEFSYTAITKEGRRETATITAPNAATAGHMLKERGLLPTSMTESKKGSFFDNLKNIGTISLGEKVGFAENLGIMLKAGISVSRSMQILVKQTKNPRFKSIITEVAQQVEAGKGLGEALGKYPGVFSNIFISMVKVGEISGNLEKSLEYLTIQLQREADLKSRVRGAMIYPAVIVSALVIIGVLMSIFVLPGLTSVFKDFGGQLPLTTRIVMAVSDFMSAHAALAITMMVGIIAGLVLFFRTAVGERLADIVLVHFYVINGIIKKINLARFSRILSSLLKSGIPIVQSLEVTADSMGNVLYRELIAEAAVNVKLGKPLTEALGKNPNLFPIIVLQMLEVGEESGTVQEMLGQLAVHYEEDVDNTLKNLSSIIEPLLLLFIGGIVGVLALALIAPIYQISQNIS